MEIDDDTEAGLRKGGGSDDAREDILHLISWVLYRQDHGNPFHPYNVDVRPLGPLRTKSTLQRIKAEQLQLEE